MNKLEYFFSFLWIQKCKFCNVTLSQGCNNLLNLISRITLQITIIFQYVYSEFKNRFYLYLLYLYKYIFIYMADYDNKVISFILNFFLF